MISDGTVVEKCKISDSGGDGVAVRGGDDVVIAKNKIENSGASGIVIVDSGPFTGTMLVKNFVRDALGVGYILGGAGKTAEKNKVLRAAQEGLRLGGTGGHSAVKNKLLSVSDDGIQADEFSDGNTIDANKVSGSGDDGIDIESTGNTVTKNKVTNSGSNGFEIPTADSVYQDNKAAKSGEFDLSATNGCNTFLGNTFKTIDPDNEDC